MGACVNGISNMWKKIFKRKREESSQVDDGSDDVERELELGYGNNLESRRIQAGIEYEEDSPTSPEVSRRDGIVTQSSRKTSSKVSPRAKSILSQVGLSSSDADQIFYSGRVINQNEDIFNNICEYVTNSQEHGYGLKVLNIVRLVRSGEFEFHHMPDCKDRFRMMLWHGTKTKCVAEILTGGFRLPGPRRQMFGKGIYFADRASKSANYCFDSRGGKMPVFGSKAYLVLCDILLGTVYNSKNAKVRLDKPPDGFDSVMCTGEKVPDRCLNKSFEGSIIPSGPTVPNTKFPNYTVAYNEYIVYNTDQIRIQFLVEVEFLERSDTVENITLNNNNAES